MAEKHYDITKDSGEKQEFSTGAHRDTQTGKGRFDLIPPTALRRLAGVYERGSARYGQRNWEQGMPIGRLLDSALRHVYDYIEGKRDEDHLAQAMWNVAGAIHMEEMVDRGLLPAELDDMPDYMPKEAKHSCSGSCGSCSGAGCCGSKQPRSYLGEFVCVRGGPAKIRTEPVQDAGLLRAQVDDGQDLFEAVFDNYRDLDEKIDDANSMPLAFYGGKSVIVDGRIGRIVQTAELTPPDEGLAADLVVTTRRPAGNVEERWGVRFRSRNELNSAMLMAISTQEF